MTPQQIHEIQQLAELIKIEDNTIEDSPDTDTIIAEFEGGSL